MQFIRVVIASVLFLNLTCLAAFGQTLTKYRIGAEVEAAGIYATDEFAPFWIRSNQYGAIPRDAPATLLQARLWRNYAVADSAKGKKKNFDWGFVINPVATYNKVNKLNFVLPEAHVKVRFRFLEFYAGRRREVIGLGDSTLTSGFYAGSGNAVPIPKIQLGTIGYVPFAFNKFLAVNAAFSHGWINNPPYIYAARLHQKHVYFRLGKPQAKTKFYFGINHQAMWAGHSEYLKAQPDMAENGQLPDSWSLYKYVVLGFTPKNWYAKRGFTSFDSYRIGNHLGTYDIALETKMYGNRLLIYHQHIYEDVSSLAFQNFPDGLYGVNMVFNQENQSGDFRLTRLTAEVLTTKDQSGSEFYITGSIYQGADNYFNHSQYYQGWSYKDAAIGTPFITPLADIDQLKFASPRYFPNNRVNMFYLGAQGTYRESLLLTLRTSLSRNYGTPGADFAPPRNQFSALLSAQMKLKNFHNTTLTAQLAADQGELFRNSYGGYLGIRKGW
ncbi:hypothetical protein DSL64_22390 [Dyadobacter luteus]|uniref:Capsule assembly Wzi family protein n=1 Tax=Dyadobacter luteus TaxID=2259619 RepID=A0A3D8Y5N9_9BACT|nr:capsule assembly Wzi family protein [Dyadobacter luteus]REA57877.1 hypothetical protein DSL64_22390 [Dyadobacter luteus]